MKTYLVSLGVFLNETLVRKLVRTRTQEEGFIRLLNLAIGNVRIVENVSRRAKHSG